MITVLVTDEQSSTSDHRVDRRRWEELAAAVLGDLGAGSNVELSVRFVDASVMAELNQRFMGGDGPTDVLSFPIDPFEDDVAPRPAGDTEAPRLLGDIVICPEVAADNAPGHAGSYDDEVALLLVHAMLHVFGMDHALEPERAEMWARERELLERHWGAPALDPWA